MIFANKLNYTLLSIYSINKNGKKNYNLYKLSFKYKFFLFYPDMYNTLCYYN